ncbi:MAG: Rnf-Nqr domain containing protein [Pseudohongiellaceae bacterium]
MSDMTLHVKRPSGASLVLRHNVVLIMLLGLTPVLAVSHSMVTAAALGLITLLVTVLACTTVSILRALITRRWRLAGFLFITAVYTTAAGILLQISHYPLFQALGIYLPLICCNSAILFRMEICAFRSRPGPALLDALAAGFGFFLVISVFGSLRELFSTGAILADLRLLVPGSQTESVGAISILEPSQNFMFINLQPGAFICLGLLVALANVLLPKRRKDTGNHKPTSEHLRVRVTQRH